MDRKLTEAAQILGGDKRIQSVHPDADGFIVVIEERAYSVVPDVEFGRTLIDIPRGMYAWTALGDLLKP